MLFTDVHTKHLYCITSDDYERTAIDLNEDNIIRYPNNLGLTGLAVASKGIVVAHDGSKDTRFTPEVDNFINATQLNNAMVGAMVDKQGEVKGVLQLFNKQEGVTEQDQVELAVLLPALGELIRTADESMEVTRLCYGKSNHNNMGIALRQCMGNINRTVFDKNRDIGANNLAMLD